VERNIMNKRTKIPQTLATAVVLLSSLVSSVVDAQTIAAGYPRTPWSASCELGLTVARVTTCSIVAVPNVEIVVETVTLQAASDNSYDHVLLSLSTQTGGQPFVWTNQIQRSIFDIREGESARHSYYSSQPLTMYVDPATASRNQGANNVQISVETDGTNTALGLSATVWLAGYAVPVVSAAK
jgi:hypothetical protein